MKNWRVELAAGGKSLVYRDMVGPIYKHTTRTLFSVEGEIEENKKNRHKVYGNEQLTSEIQAEALVVNQLVTNE